MDEKEIVKIQRYIYKRPKNVTSEDVINYIKKKTSNNILDISDWNKLLIPCCSNPDVHIFKWLLKSGATIEENYENLLLMLFHREKRLDFLKNMVDVLEAIFENISDEKKEEVEGRGLCYSSFFNTLYVSEWLLRRNENINLNYQIHGKNAIQFAKEYGEKNDDFTLCDLLLKFSETRNIFDTREFYTGIDEFFGYTVYSKKSSNH